MGWWIMIILKDLVIISQHRVLNATRVWNQDELRNKPSSRGPEGTIWRNKFHALIIAGGTVLLFFWLSRAAHPGNWMPEQLSSHTPEPNITTTDRDRNWGLPNLFVNVWQELSVQVHVDWCEINLACTFFSTALPGSGVWSMTTCCWRTLLSKDWEMVARCCKDLQRLFIKISRAQSKNLTCLKLFEYVCSTTHWFPYFLSPECFTLWLSPSLPWYHKDP